jgi:hypothetical protein
MRSDVVNDRKRYHVIRKILGWPVVLVASFCIYLFVDTVIDNHFYYKIGWPDAIFLAVQTFLIFLFVDLDTTSWLKNDPEFIPYFTWYKVSFYTGLAFASLLFIYLKWIASFHCPFCNKVIDMNTNWECFYCHTVHTRPLWNTILHKCRWPKCWKKPLYFECPHFSCKQTIYLMFPAPATGAPTANVTNIAVARSPSGTSGGP